MASVSLSLLGGFRGECDAQPLDLSARKAKALLAFLALHAGQSFTRDRLAALLWEESGDSRARHSLRQALAVMRKALGEHDEALSAGSDEVMLTSEAVYTDVAEFEKLCDAEDDLEAAVALYRGDLLEGFAARAPGFEDWLMGERSRLRERALAVMTALLEQRATDNDCEPAVQLGLRLLALDPLREPAHRLLMELYRRQGRPGAALRQYRRCQSLLHRELGVAPEAQTQSLYQDLLRERYVRPGAAPVSSEPDDTRAPDVTDIAPLPARPALRHAVLLVISLARPGLASDPEELLAHSENFHVTVERQFESYGGRVISRMGDTVLGVFGVPLTRGNESARALRAAFAMQRALQLLTPTSSAGIGVASGRVLVTPTADTLQVTGEAVNAATTLAATAAAGETLAADAVVQTVGTLVDAQAVHAADAPPAKRCWRVLEKLLVGVARPGFVGRRAERRQFIAALGMCLESGVGQSFLVRGEAGLGKTRLLEQVANDARERGFTCVTASFLDFGADASQHGVRGLARAFAAVTGVEDLASSAQRLIEAGVVSESQRVLLNDLLGVQQSGSELALYDAMEASERRAQLSSLLTQLMRRLARQGPMLVVLEDVHWVDSHLLPYLSAFGQAAAECPALFVMTSRVEGEPLDPAWRGAMRSAALTTIELAPMRDDDATALAASILGDDDEERARLCAKRAHGNPLFIEQLARAGASADVLPDSVQSVVWWRLDHLPAQVRRVAQVASVLGQHFPRVLLQELSAADDESIATLIGQGLLSADGHNLLFGHALLREGIYATLMRAERTTLHQRAARWHEGRDKVLVAEHLQRAADPRAADAYYDAAAEQAALYRYDRGLRLVEHGLAIVSDRDTRFRLTLLEGRLQRALNCAADSLQGYRRALAMAVDGGEKGHAGLGIVAALRLLDRHEEALAALDDAEQAFGDVAGPREKARIWHFRGRLAFPLGRLDECLHAEQEALHHAREAASPSLEANALSGLGDAYYQRGRMLTANANFERSVSLARAHALGRAEVANLAMRGLTRLYSLDIEGGEADVVNSVELAQRVGDKRSEIIAADCLAILSNWRADPDTMERWLVRGLELARSTGARRFEVDMLCGHAMMCSRRGSQADGVAYADQAAALADSAGPSYCWPFVLAARAMLAPDFGSCSELIERARVYLARGSVGHNHFHVLGAGIECALGFGQWSTATEYCDALAEYTAGEPVPWSDLLIDYGKTMARHGGETGSVSASDLSALAVRVRQAQQFCLLPRLEAAIAALRG